jgi:hypothetical protein
MQMMKIWYKIQTNCTLSTNLTTLARITQTTRIEAFENAQKYKQLNKRFILAWALGLIFFCYDIVVKNSTLV